jgi:chromosome segregation ATPase
MFQLRKKAELLAQVEQYLSISNPSDMMLNQIKGLIQSLNQAFPGLGQLLRVFDRLRVELEEKRNQAKRLDDTEADNLTRQLKAKESLVREELARQRQIYQQELDQLIKAEAALFDSTKPVEETLSTKMEKWFKDLLREFTETISTFLDVLIEIESVIATIHEADHLVSEIAVVTDQHTETATSLSKKTESIQKKIESTQQSSGRLDETYHEKQQQKLARIKAQQEELARKIAEMNAKRAEAEARLREHREMFERLHHTYLETFVKLNAMSTLLSAYHHKVSLPFADSFLPSSAWFGRFAGVCFDSSSSSKQNWQEHLPNLGFGPMNNGF